VSARGIKDQIQKLVQGEDAKNPLTDQAIVNILKKGGVNIARRTVAKYRDQLGVLSGRDAEARLIAVAAAARPYAPDPAPRQRDDRVDVSVLVPAKDEAENLPLFMELAERAFAGDPHVRYEVVVVDDGSVDATWARARELRARYPWLRAARTAPDAASPTRCAPGT
jgi:hypothetical protein